jgi:hypothetical protein
MQAVSEWSSLFFPREPSQLADMEGLPHEAFTDAIMLS